MSPSEMVQSLRDHFEKQTADMGKEAYLEVIVGFMSILEGYEDCVRAELENEAEESTTDSSND